MGKLTDGLTSAGGGGDGPMKPGDTKVIVDSKTGKIFTIHRTDRPYAFDLRDAYNEAMAPDARQRGLEWYVADNGELKLGENAKWQRDHTNEMARKAERERQEWLRNNANRPS